MGTTPVPLMAMGTLPLYYSIQLVDNYTYQKAYLPQMYQVKFVYLFIFTGHTFQFGYAFPHIKRARTF